MFCFAIVQLYQVNTLSSAPLLSGKRFVLMTASLLFITLAHMSLICNGHCGWQGGFFKASLDYPDNAFTLEMLLGELMSTQGFRVCRIPGWLIHGALRKSWQHPNPGFIQVLTLQTMCIE